jgi:hypothetical protein
LLINADSNRHPVKDLKQKLDVPYGARYFGGNGIARIVSERNYKNVLI